jgi:hypothetical protein
MASAFCLRDASCDATRVCRSGDRRAPRADRAGWGGVRLCHRSRCLDEFVVTIHPGPTGGLDIACSFTPREDLELNRLDLFPAGTFLNMVRVINFRNRHFTEATWPELLLDGGGCETDTFSEDWQAAPHPTALLFQKLETNLFCGMKELGRTYGMFLKVEELSVRHWYVNYGKRRTGCICAPGRCGPPRRCGFSPKRTRPPTKPAPGSAGCLSARALSPPPKTGRWFPGTERTCLAKTGNGPAGPAS